MKNPETLLDLSPDNCLDKLSIEDWNILFEFDEEFHRTSEFERLYPNKDNVEKYSKFFP